MNFFNKKTRRIMAAVILIAIVAMLVTMVVPYLL